jgi:hypothetical protein
MDTEEGQGRRCKGRTERVGIDADDHVAGSRRDAPAPARSRAGEVVSGLAPAFEAGCVPKPAPEPPDASLLAHGICLGRPPDYRLAQEQRRSLGRRRKR